MVNSKRSIWSVLLAVVLAMVAMASLAVTSFAVTDGGAGNGSAPVVDSIDELSAVLDGTKDPAANVNYDVDGNGIVEYDDLTVLKHQKEEGNSLPDPVDADTDDLLDLLTSESKGSLQSLIVKGDSTRALVMAGTQSLTLDFAAPVDLSSAEKLLIDTLWTSGDAGSFQVVFLSGDKETAPVTVTAGQAGWSTVEVPFDDPTGVIVGNVTGIRIILDEGDTTYFDNFRLEGASGRVRVTADGQVYWPVAGTTYGELSTPAKTFYTFGGWMLEGNLVEASAQIENNAVLEAKWTLVASDDNTVTVADKGNNAFSLTMDGGYKQIRFDFMLKSGDFYMSYADDDTTVSNNPVITIVDANGNAVSQSKVQSGQWYTAYIYGGSIVDENVVIQDGAHIATFGILTIAEGVQMQVRNLETMTGQYGVRFLGRDNTVWKMTDGTAVVDGKLVNGYDFIMDTTDLWESRWTFSIYNARYTKMTYEFYIYELGGAAANGQVTGLTYTPATNESTRLSAPVVYDMEGNQIASADVRAGNWYRVEIDMTGVSGTQYLYSAVTAGTYKAYIANVNFVGNGEMIDNLSPATTVTVNKAGADGSFVDTPVTRDTDRGTYHVVADSANWADRAIRVKLNDTTKELIQLDFRFVTSKDASGKDVAPTLVASTGVSGTLKQAQYIILDENDAPVTTLQTGKWYRMFINANGGNVFGLVPATTGEVKLQIEGLDTFNTDELPAAMVSTAGNMSAVLTRFGKLQYIYAGNGANTVTITLDSALYKQLRFAVKSDSEISVTGATMEITGSGVWKDVVISNNGGNLPTTLTLNVGEGSLVIKDLVAYTTADAPEEKTQSDIFRGLQDDEMLISGFIGPREEEQFGMYRFDQRSNPMASLARDDIFKLIADVGINYIADQSPSYSGSSKESAQHILRLAAKYGINYFMSAADVVQIGNVVGEQEVYYLFRSIMQMIYESNIADKDAIKAKLQELYQYESFGGLYLRDEPTADLFDEILDAVTKINQAKQEMGNVTLNQFVNLLPWYSETGSLTNFQNYTSPSGGAAGISNKAITWEEYLKASVLDTGMNYFSFDIYPFNTDGLNSEFLNYLGMANYVAQNQTNTPWMGYAQVGGGLPGYNAEKAITTEAELNWDVNAMLAFGAKGIQYFMNVTPPHFDLTSETLDPHSLIDAYGNTTAYYDYVKEINAQIQAIDHVLMKSQHLGVIVNGSGACGYSESTGKTTLLNTTDELGTVKLSSVSGIALIGAFDYNGQTALLVVNNTIADDGADTVTLNFTGNYTYEIIQNALTTLKSGTTVDLSLEAGRSALIVIHESAVSRDVTINFELNYASAQATLDPIVVTLGENAVYPELYAPTREGYTFGGWYLDAACTEPVKAGDVLAVGGNQMVLYAKWTLVPVESPVTLTAPGSMADPVWSYTEADGWHWYIADSGTTIDAYNRRVAVTIPVENATRLSYEVKLNSISGNATQLIGLYGSVGQYVYDLETGELVGTGNSVTFELGKWYRIVTYKTDNSSLGTNYTFAYVGNASTDGNASASFRNFEAYDHYWTTDSGQNAATVSYGLENGENIYVYSTLSHPINASEWSRRMELTIPNTAGDIISLKMKLISVTNEDGTPAANRTMDVHLDGNTVLPAVFTDAEGNIVADSDLELGEWYTLSWISTGAANYAIWPFTGSVKVHAEIHMKDVAVTAAENVNVAFDLNYEGASGTPETVQVTQGSAYGELYAPTREGYTFDGWYLDAACTGEAVTAETTVIVSHTLYAKWRVLPAVVVATSSNLRDATEVEKTAAGVESAQKVQVYTKAANVSANNEDAASVYFSNEGGYDYISFDFYFSAFPAGQQSGKPYVAMKAYKALTGDYENTAADANTLELQIWNKTTGDLDTEYVDTAVWGKVEMNTWYTMTCKVTDWAKLNLVLWSGASAEMYITNVEGHDGSAPTPPEAPELEISFDLNYDGAGEGPEAITRKKGDAYGTLPEVEREGYTFIDWYTDAACSGEAVTEEGIVSTSHTLYAKWAPVPTVVVKTEAYLTEADATLKSSVGIDTAHTMYIYTKAAVSADMDNDASMYFSNAHGFDYISFDIYFASMPTGQQVEGKPYMAMKAYNNLVAANATVTTQSADGLGLTIVNKATGDANTEYVGAVTWGNVEMNTWYTVTCKVTDWARVGLVLWSSTTAEVYITNIQGWNEEAPEGPAIVAKTEAYLREMNAVEKAELGINARQTMYRYTKTAGVSADLDNDASMYFSNENGYDYISFDFYFASMPAGQENGLPYVAMKAYNNLVAANATANTQSADGLGLTIVNKSTGEAPSAGHVYAGAETWGNVEMNTWYTVTCKVTDWARAGMVLWGSTSAEMHITNIQGWNEEASEEPEGPGLVAATAANLTEADATLKSSVGIDAAQTMYIYTKSAGVSADLDNAGSMYFSNENGYDYISFDFYFSSFPAGQQVAGKPYMAMKAYNNIVAANATVTTQSADGLGLTIVNKATGEANTEYVGTATWGNVEMATWYTVTCKVTDWARVGVVLWGSASAEMYITNIQGS